MRKALFALLLAACGDNAVTKIPLVEFLNGRHLAECERLTRCGLFTSESVCNAYVRRTSDATLVEAVEAGKMRYDGAAAIDCLAALSVVGCDKTQEDARVTPVSCIKALHGDVEDRDVCAFDGECRSGSCDEPSCARDTCCTGMCADSTVAPIDGPCLVDTQCVEGAYCSRAKLCRARAAEGQRCEDEVGCGFGLACVGLTDLDAGICRKLPLLGESCPYMLCAEINASCRNGVCTALGLPGTACTQDRQCSPFGECDETVGLCIDTPKLGMPCDTYCAGESWCDAGTCAAPLMTDSPCTADDQCATTYCKEGVAFDQCTEPKACI